ncbi:alpha/beta hydrolase [Chloroflexota bacterium]
MRNIGLICVIAILLVSCGGSPTEEPQASVSKPTSPEASATVKSSLTEPPAATEAVQVTEVPSIEPLPPDPQRIEFTASDGENLVGIYYPAKVNPAPMVVLMHWAGGDQSDWDMIGMTSWLTNRGDFQGGGLFSKVFPSLLPYQFPVLSDELSFAVFTFDFRGFGESGGDPNSVTPESWILDAVAAYETASKLPGVDSHNVVGVGASIGSDGVVDGCGDRCLGALSLSPGSYLNQSYEMTVKDLKDKMKIVNCIAADDDPTSAIECKSVDGNADRVVIYPQGGHGMMLFDNSLNLDPDLGQVILDFLFEVFGLG